MGTQRNLRGEARGDPLELIYREVTARVINMDAWIVDGAYLEWTEPLLRQAEIIVWMDVPWRVASYRILSRHIKATIARNNPFPGWRQLYRFWLWSRRYYKDRNPPGITWGVPHTRGTAIEHLAPYKNKLVVCHNQKDAELLLASRR